ncbi:MAG: hypothetical protein ACJ71D_04300 [Nitrososphaera sp.]
MSSKLPRVLVVVSLSVGSCAWTMDGGSMVRTTTRNTVPAKKFELNIDLNDLFDFNS